MSGQNRNTIVYNYGGPNQDTHHLTSITTGLISRTGNKGLKTSNKKLGDYVLITSRVGNDPHGALRVSSGIYLGQDHSGCDPWQDVNASYDRDCIERFKYIATVILDNSYLENSRRYLNDNGLESNRVLDLTIKQAR
jgi:hypothetical protein